VDERIAEMVREAAPEVIGRRTAREVLRIAYSRVQAHLVTFTTVKVDRFTPVEVAMFCERCRRSVTVRYRLHGDQAEIEALGLLVRFTEKPHRREVAA